MSGTLPLRRSPVGHCVGLALGGGSARGLAHIAMLDVFDELGVRPAVIAGTSFGSIVGALYAAGLSARDIRAFAEDLLGTRAQVLKRLAAGSLETLAGLWSPRTPAVVDGLALFELLLPAAVRVDIETLPIPFVAVAADFYAMEQVVIDQGPVIQAIAASSALPSMLRPVVREGRVLIDGGFVNPTPWDVLAGRTHHTVAIDVAGEVQRRAGPDVPGALETWIGATQILFRSITREKLKHGGPDILVKPAVGAFTTLDFLKVREILAAAEPAKEDLKRRLAALLEARISATG